MYGELFNFISIKGCTLKYDYNLSDWQFIFKIVLNDYSVVSALLLTMYCYSCFLSVPILCMNIARYYMSTLFIVFSYGLNKKSSSKLYFGT